MPTFFLTAAEHSGDALGAALIAALRRRFPDAQFTGVGGPRMADAGCRLLANPVARSAMLVGALFTESRYWFKLLRRIKAELRALKPAVVIPIDSSFINLRIAGLAHQAKLPVCYYVAPQVWASRPWRVKRIRQRVDTLCCVLPFEEAYFRQRSVNAVYVGHPMFDTPCDTAESDPRRLQPPLPGIEEWGGGHDGAAQAVASAGSIENRKSKIENAFPGVFRVAIFPGSRSAEINAHMPPMLEILSEIKGRFANVHIVAVAPSQERAWQIRHHLRNANTPVDIRVGDGGQGDAVIRWADLVLTKSGTATLQVARQHKPMVVMFAVAWWKWHLFARFLINTRYIALVNILAGRELVPEFIPFHGSPLPVARECIELLSHPERRDKMSDELAGLVAPLLPRQGVLAADRVAAEVARLCAPRPEGGVGANA